MNTDNIKCLWHIYVRRVKYKETKKQRNKQKQTYQQTNKQKTNNQTNEQKKKHSII